MQPAGSRPSPVGPLGLAVALVAALATGGPAAAAPDPDSQPGVGPTYDNTYAKDFIMDAPWRVVDATTPIPLTIILKDCDVDYLNELYWIRCWDVTGGGSTILWNHDFGDEELGDDPSEHNYWTWITTVTEGHPTLPNGTLLTPANLGYAAGDAIQLQVSVHYEDNWFDWTDTRYLRVHVGGGPFPWPADWFGGDTHYHTMYTNNIAEFGAPVPAVRYTAVALGLHWLAITDHSCDLDETGDGAFSYATHQWEFTLQTPAGIQTHYRDVFAHGSTWGAIGADVAEWDGPDFRLCRGTEINLASIDSDSYDKTLHCIYINDEYVHSPNSGAIGERPVFPSVPDGLDALTPNGLAFAAHPRSDLGGEWGGIDWTVNGDYWGDEDFTIALLRDGFRGVQSFNTRQTRYSTDQMNPWADFDAGVLPDDPYPNELLEGIDQWDGLLRGNLGDPPRKVFLAGGSDAHGDFNFASFIGLDNYATDNAIGKVQTVVRVPGGYSPGNLPPMDLIKAAWRAGCAVACDGPFLEIGIDTDQDGSWYGPGDLKLGDHGRLNPGHCPPVSLRWTSLPEFGPVTSVRLLCGDSGATTELLAFDPSASGQGFAGSADFDPSGLGLAGPVYLRAELLTSDGSSGHRAYTNPIWVIFDPQSGIAGNERLPDRPRLLAAVPNPFNPRTEIRFALPRPASVSLTVYDLAGKRVKTLFAGESRSAGPHGVVWDGCDQGGQAVPSGSYLVRLVAGSEVSCGRLTLLR